MRVPVDIPDEHIAALDRIARAQKRTRASLIHDVIREYLERNEGVSVRQAFGLLAGSEMDALEYQAKIRSEW